jgi:hypothetical protein
MITLNADNVRYIDAFLYRVSRSTRNVDTLPPCAGEPDAEQRLCAAEQRDRRVEAGRIYMFGTLPRGEAFRIVGVVLP